MWNLCRSCQKSESIPTDTLPTEPNTEDMKNKQQLEDASSSKARVCAGGLSEVTVVGGSIRRPCVLRQPSTRLGWMTLTSETRADSIAAITKLEAIHGLQASTSGTAGRNTSKSKGAVDLKRMVLSDWPGNKNGSIDENTSKAPALCVPKLHKTSCPTNFCRNDPLRKGRRFIALKH